MEKYQYPKTRDYFRALSPDQKRELAKGLGTSLGYLKQIVGGHSRPSATFAAKMDRATKGKAPKRELRPDVFA